MSKTRWIFLIIVIGLAIAGFYGYSEYTRGHPDLSGAKADIAISAPNLLAEFAKDENLANKRFLNKVTSCRGAVKSIDKDQTGSVSIALETGDLMANISCELDPRHIGDAAKVRVADTITVTGICTGMLSDVVLVQCSFVKK
ncbi:MAG: hypothetical protein WCH46_06745 [bacterium]